MAKPMNKVANTSLNCAIVAAITTGSGTGPGLAGEDMVLLGLDGQSLHINITDRTSADGLPRLSGDIAIWSPAVGAGSEETLSEPVFQRQENARYHRARGH